MASASIVAALSAPAAAGDAGPDPVALPSGYAATLQEVREEELVPGGALRARWRFVMTDLGKLVVDQDALSRDMDHLCSEIALEAARDAETPHRIVISLAEKPTEFGVAAPAILQVFEAYTVADDRCMWEAF